MQGRKLTQAGCSFPSQQRATRDSLNGPASAAERRRGIQNRILDGYYLSIASFRSLLLTWLELGSALSFSSLAELIATLFFLSYTRFYIITKPKMVNPDDIPVQPRE
jgi:hypothetical protein